MKNEKDKWIEEVIHSMQSSQKAKAPLDLFQKIEQNLIDSSAKVISLKSWKRIAVAAVLLFAINAFALIKMGSSKTDFSEVELNDGYEISLMSDYQIYDL